MSWRFTLTAGGVTEPPAVVHKDETILEVVVFALAQSALRRAPFTLDIAPVTDGGWTEAPAPTTTWDPRAAA